MTEQSKTSIAIGGVAGRAEGESNQLVASGSPRRDRLRRPPLSSAADTPASPLPSGFPADSQPVLPDSPTVVSAGTTPLSESNATIVREGLKFEVNLSEDPRDPRSNITVFTLSIANFSAVPLNIIGITPQISRGVSLEKVNDVGGGIHSTRKRDFY
jgi:hypothetical protein